MLSTSPLSARVWRGRIIGFAVVAVVVGVSAEAAEVLFPRPLHIVRRIEDPLAGSPVTVHEYCAGDRVVTVNGSRVAIADYGRQTITEIDREAGTYSVTRFEELAASSLAKRGTTSSEWETTALGVRGTSGRSADAFELKREDGHEKQTIELHLDRNARISRAALGVLIGAAYPQPRRSEHEAIARAATRRQERQVAAMSDGEVVAETFALPVEQTITYEIAGERIVSRNVIVEMRDETAPDDIQRIPPGAKLVESRVTRAARELRALDERH